MVQTQMGNICSFSLSCDALFSRCLDCSISKATYISELKENLDALQDELQKLIEVRNDVMTKVNIVEQQRKKRTDQVQGWLARVQDIAAQVDELLKLKPQEINKLCLGGYCSTDCKSSYEFGKRVADMLEVVNNLRAEGVFHEVAQEIPEDPMDCLQTELQKLIAARKDVEIRVTTAEQQRKQRTEKVKLWLASVQAIEVEVFELQEHKSQELLGESYEVRRRVADALKVVTDLLVEGVFQEVAQDILEDPMDTLQTELQKLIATKKDVENRVTIAEQQQKQRTEKVKLWLSSVQAVEAEVVELQKLQSQEIKNSHYGERKSSYEFGKRVTETLKVVTALMAEGVFQVLAHDIPEDPVDEKPMDPNIVGQQSILSEVWSCLNQEGVRIVGLYGTGGVGKTTLLKQINNSFLDNERHNFDVVIWTVVSKDHKLENIQDDIGKKIGLCGESWSKKNLEEKAHDIFKILKKKKFVLLLDDIWERVDLIKLGVPPLNPKFASKVVFTTRSFAVCRQMEVDKEFEVKCLQRNEAWELFEKKVGRDILNSHQKIPKLAEIVAKECRGLPLALNTVGRAMACKKTLEEWKDAVEVLRTSAFEFPGMGNEVYPLLKFSYDNLPNQKTRSCFLYCTLFQEDCRIIKRYLIECWLAEGFLDEYDGKRAIDRGYSIIGDLTRSCLLEEEVDCVVMHDVIRDMALWIACKIEKEKENFLVQAGAGLSKAPDIGKWEGVKRMSLMNNKIRNLSETPTCPNLLTLFLGFNRLSIISNDFFQFMPSLRLLNLAYNDCLEELPPGISNLISLQHLELSYTGLVKLPEEMKALVNLRYLSLVGTFYLSRFPQKILSNLLRLRTLSMVDCGVYVKATEDSILFDDGESLIEELLCLEHLNALSITARSACALEKFSSFHKFRSCCERLCLRGIKGSESLNVSSLAYMKRLHTLLICFCDVKVLEIDCDGNLRQCHVFDCLHKVEVYNCHELNHVTWLILAPNLKMIEISNCNGMEEMINVEKLVEIQDMWGNLIPFSVIEYLELWEVPKLKSIYPNALPFLYLKKIEVYGCPMLTKLPLNSSSAKERKIVIKGETCWWEKLQWEDEVTQNVFGSCFEIYEGDCNAEDDEPNDSDNNVH